MKLQQILQEGKYMDQIKQSLGAEYWPKSMKYEPDDPEPQDTVQQSDQDRVENKIFMPSHTDIEETDIVRLTKNGKTVKHDQWSAIKDYIRNNWDQMRGTYKITQNRSVLHSFDIS